jgi:hypothetical protein
MSGTLLVQRDAIVTLQLVYSLRERGFTPPEYFDFPPKFSHVVDFISPYISLLGKLKEKKK